MQQSSLLALPLALLALAPLAGCGSAPAATSATASQAILGGTVDDADKGAVGLAVGIPGVFFSGHCSGSLIAPNLVLTAHHCVAMQSSGQSSGVVCGKSGFAPPGGGDIFRASVETVRPLSDGAGFYKGTGTVLVPQNNDLCGNDVALIQLEGAGVPASVATPIVPRIDLSAQDEEVFAAVGFGLTDPVNQTGDGTRMRFDGATVTCTGTECIYGVKGDEWQGTSPTCPGDSGGPAIDAQGRVFGVLSRGPDGCTASVYSDVAAWKDMLVSTALSAAAAGGYEPPFWATTGVSTPPDPVGVACDALKPCAKSWVCAGKPDGTGVCEPPCSEADTTCPDTLTCDTTIGACIEPAWLPTAAPEPAASSSSGGCALAGRPAPRTAFAAWLGAGLLALVARRRVRRTLR